MGERGGEGKQDEMRVHILKKRFDVQKEKAHFGLTPTLNPQRNRPPTSIVSKGGIIHAKHAKRESTSGMAGCWYVCFFRRFYRVRR
jgi:hypothetical protein